MKGAAALSQTTAFKKFRHTAFAVAALLLLIPSQSLIAQGLQKEGAIDTIIGTDVRVGEEDAASNQQRVIAAIKNSAVTAAEARKKFSLDNVEIIFLTGIGDENSPIGATLREYEPQVIELRESLQGSAIFYHAVDSHSIMLNRILGVEFDDRNGVTIFVSRELLDL